MKSQVIKEITLSEELRNAIRLIEIGFGEFQNLGGANDFYHLPMQLMSSGFERLMKCHICYGYLEQQGQLPDSSYLQNCGGGRKNGNGHNLLELKKVILSDYFKNPRNATAIAADKDFMLNDTDLNTLIDILSEFGKFARYYNLDVVTDRSKPSRDVESEWKQYENNIALNIPGLVDKLGDLNTQKEACQIIDREIIMTLEKFTRGICRQFTLGELGKLALQHSGVLQRFYSMNESSIGNNDYRQLTMSRNNDNKAEKSSAKRTWKNRIKRKKNKTYKHKKITKDEFDGDWPFYANEVIVECRDQHWCVITIEGKDYALNGSAQRKFKLESVHDAGMAVLGKSISPFINIALDLWEK